MHCDCQIVAGCLQISTSQQSKVNQPQLENPSVSWWSNCWHIGNVRHVVIGL
jgi:hypothetical protein